MPIPYGHSKGDHRAAPKCLRSRCPESLAPTTRHRATVGPPGSFGTSTVRIPSRPVTTPELSDDEKSFSGVSVRPSWRGLIHRWATLSFVPLFGALIVLADSGGDRLACIVYAAGVLTMLGVSATYHSGRLSETATGRAKRIDHATILMAIAGSYTAVATVALDGPPATRLLTAVWIAAPIGAVVRMVWLHAPYPVTAAVYIVVGWIALIEVSALADALTGFQFGMVLAGGGVYTIGGVVYALHRPNPWPATFGYHEVFHALVVIGAAMHYLAVLSMVTAAS